MRKISLTIFILFVTLIAGFTFLSLGKSNGQNSTSSSSGECIICTQVIPNCSSNETIVPQSCNECAHCVSTSSNSSGCPQIQTDCAGEPSGCGAKSGIYDPKICMCVCPDSLSSSGNLSTFNNNFAGRWIGKKIILKLCVKDQELEGIINIPMEIEDGNIISQTIISNNEISIQIKDKNDLSRELNLKLVNKRHLKIVMDDETFETKRVGFLRKCPFSSSSSGSLSSSSSSSSGDIVSSSSSGGINISSSSSSSSGGLEYYCSSKGSCSGPNDKSCPTGTYCINITCGPPVCCNGPNCSPLFDCSMPSPPNYVCFPNTCDYPCPICCSPDTRIRTTGEQKRIADIKEGELVLTDNGKAVRVKKVSKTPVKNHKILNIKLSDGTILEISPGHPTADGRKFKDLKMGDVLDGRMVIETKLIPYVYSHTYDILPDSKSGNYYANGVLIGSTLK